jgi:hypothetical protein
MSLFDSVRARRGGTGCVDARCIGGLRGLPGDCIESRAVMGEEGTVGRTAMGGGRRFGGARLNVERTAVAGGEGTINEVFHTGAEGGGPPWVVIGTRC